MADDPRQWLYDKIGPPPTSPQQYTAEHPGEEVPQQIYAAWRKWNDREQEEVERAAEQSGETDPNKILESLGYRNEPDQGKSMFARYGSGGNKAGVLQTKSQDAFNLAVSRGHFTLDPKTGKYFNRGRSQSDDPRTWQWVDEHGGAIAPPMGGSPQGYGSGWGYQRNAQGQRAGYSNLGPQQSSGEFGGMPSSGPPQGYLPELPGGPPSPPSSGGAPSYMGAFQMPNMQNQNGGWSGGGGANGPQPNIYQQRSQDQQNQNQQDNSPYKQLLGGRQTPNPQSNTLGAF